MIQGENSFLCVFKGTRGPPNTHILWPMTSRLMPSKTQLPAMHRQSMLLRKRFRFSFDSSSGEQKSLQEEEKDAISLRQPPKGDVGNRIMHPLLDWH